MNDAIEILTIWKRNDMIAVGPPHGIREGLLKMSMEAREGIKSDLIEAVANAIDSIESPDFSVDSEETLQ